MNKEKLHINFFFRKHSENFHSIEELFYSIQRFLPENISFTNIYLPFHSGFVGRIKNIFFVRKYKASVNHITGDVNYITLGLPKKSTVLTVHDIGSALTLNKFKRKIISLFWFIIPFQRVKKIITISEFSKNEILSHFKLNKQKIIVVPNCVSDKFKPVLRAFDSRKPTILIIGTKKNKNIETAFKAVKNINCKLKIIGKLNISQKKILSEYHLHYENLINLNFEEVVENYQSSDILLFPSFYEGFGMPIIEAQATGISVITSKIEPMKSVAGEGAVFVDPKDSSQIRNALLSIIENESFRKKIIQLGFKNVKQYSCQKVAKRLIEIYTQIIDEK